MQHLRRAYERARFGPYFEPDYERDVFLVSYPRSGNTWMRSVIAHVLTGRPPESLKELDYIVPDIHYRVRRRHMTERPLRVVKSHDPFWHGTRAARFRRVIFIVRDPRKVARSYHRYLQAIDRVQIPLEQFAEDFFMGRYWPGSWAEHTRSWMETFSAPRRSMITVRYEDLAAGDTDPLRKIFEFLDLAVPGDIDELLSHHTLEKMALREKSGNRPEIARDKDYFIGGDGGGERDGRRAIEKQFKATAALNADVLKLFHYM